MTAFLAANEGYGAVTIVGVPLDMTESFRSGAGKGPAAIREFSQSLETYSPLTGRDLSDLSLGDIGDLPISHLGLEDALRVIGDGVMAAAKRGLVIALGGEHTITFAAVRALRQETNDLAVIQLDAHLDLLDEYLDLRVSHATVMRRVLDVITPDDLLQLGVRSGTRAEFQLARRNRLSSSRLKLSDAARAAIVDRPVYLSVDIDVLDPSVAPGTGYPEPGGFSFVELADFIYSLAGLRVIAVDVCEVCPAHDPAGITSIAAAKLVREIATVFR